MSDATKFNPIEMADAVCRTRHTAEALWLACHGIADRDESAALCRLVEHLNGEIDWLSLRLAEINGAAS